MPRIRTIKPEFWTDKKIIRLSRDARLFFIGLWNFADDNGVVEADPLQLKALIFPVDSDIGIEEIEKFLSELENLELIKLYEVDGTRYLWIKNFLKHQKIDRPRKSNLPLPEESNEISTSQPTSDEEKIFQMKSLEIIPGKGIGKGIGKEKDQGKEEEKKECSANALHVAKTCVLTTCNVVSQNSPPLEAKTSQKSPPLNKENTQIQKHAPPEKITKPDKTKGKHQKPTENGFPRCPYDEIVALYHEILPELPKVKVLNDTRKSYLRTRWREVLVRPELLNVFVPSEEILQKPLKEVGLLWFKRYFEYVRESDFLCGRTEPTGGRSAPFQADFEWLIRPTNFVKVLEGRYHRRNKASPLSQLSPKARKSAIAAMHLLEELKHEEEGRRDVVH